MDRADAAGFGIAAALHVGLLTALVLLVPRNPVALPGAPTIEISYEEDVGAVSAGETTTPAAASAAPELGAPEDAAPAPEPVAEPEPQPAPAPPQAQPQPRPTPAPPQPRPQPRAQPPRPAAQPAQRQAPQQKAAPQPRANPRPARANPQPKAAPPRGGSGAATAARGSRLGPDFLKGIGSDPASTSQRTAGAVLSNEAKASMDAAILRALQPCRRQALPAPEAGAIRVRVEVTLNANGSLASARVLSVTGATGNLAIYERRMRDLATNVIEQCAPIRGLPAEYYNVQRGWRTFRYVFPA
jgi:outer membrane biosynthesis protein TonB